VTAVACTVTLLVTGWPSFWLLQVRLKLFSPSTANTTGTLLPLVCCAPLQAPLAVQLLACVVDQLRSNGGTNGRRCDRGGQLFAE
jgi:hypothetical protein